MKKMFCILIAGLSFELDASEMKNPLQEISKEEDQHMSEVAALQTGRIEQSEVSEEEKKETTDETKLVTVKRMVPYHEWVFSGYWRESPIWCPPVIGNTWIDTSHIEIRYKKEVFIVPSTEVAKLKAIDEKFGVKYSIVEEK